MIIIIKWSGLRRAPRASCRRPVCALLLQKANAEGASGSLAKQCREGRADNDRFLRSLCADSSSRHISAGLFGRLTVENCSLRKTSAKLLRKSHGKMSKPSLARNVLIHHRKGLTRKRKYDETNIHETNTREYIKTLAREIPQALQWGAPSSKLSFYTERGLTAGWVRQLEPR